MKNYHRKGPVKSGQYVKAFQDGGAVEKRIGQLRDVKGAERELRLDRPRNVVANAQEPEDWQYEPGRGRYEQEQNRNPKLAAEVIVRNRNHLKDNGDPTQNSYHSFEGKGPTKVRAWQDRRRRGLD